MTTDNIGTRVFKKTSQNGMITVYLGKRDFVDHLTHVDEIDGVVLIDVNYLRNRKVFGHILAAFRYGREDLDVLGFNFRKDLYLASKCIYPSHEKYQVTRLQERLMKKLGNQAFPFFFQLPTNCPASVTLQPAPGDTGKPCGVDYELRIYVGESLDSKPEKRNSVKLAIRKVTYAPSCQGVQPFVEISKDFVMSPNKLHLEASLDKELYHHGEEIAVNVHVDNNSNRTVKKVKVSIKQFAEICIFSTAQYRCTVAELESEDGCPVSPGFKLTKVYYLKPLLANNKSKKGLALDGQLKQEDSNLASSTISRGQKENLGIIVKYKVKVKLCLGPLGGDLVAELPFTLMHPKPNDLDENNHTNGNINRNNHLNVIQSNTLLSSKNNMHENSNNITNSKMNAKNNQKKNDSNDQNLIQLDTDSSEDDIIFEDFARLRLRGESK